MDNNMPKIKKETKNKIRVEFDRTPLAQRLKAKYLNAFFYKKILVAIFRFVFFSVFLISFCSRSSRRFLLHS